MASKVSSRQQAMAKARERRSALDQDRVARDRRVEEATAQVLLQLQDRAAAEQAVQVANAQIGAVLRRLLDDEGIAAHGVGGTGRPDGERGPPAGAGGADRGRRGPGPDRWWCSRRVGGGGHLAAVPPLEGATREPAAPMAVTD